MLIHRGEEFDEKQESLKVSPHKLLINYKGKNSTILKIEKKMDQILTTGSIKSLIRDKWVTCFQI